ncbi:hypothetical protein MTO96_051793 [Rhipicephalus appendiculatus]
MERLLRRRKSVRSKLDAIVQEAEGLLREQELSPQVSVSIDRINAIYGQITKIDESILNETPDDLLETEITDASNYGDKIVTLTSKLRFAIQNDHLSPVPSSSSTTELRELYDEVQVHVRSLKSLGTSPSTYCSKLREILL